ncbi:transcriptional regulator domain-containing protein [Ancylobacter sp.]|uniref:transcriptional regulator domain-containing protein n=1 Tax=Ancylobacter sp. TaxID=1872567 RepID=UPI003BAD5303
MALESVWQSSEAYAFVDTLSPPQLAWEWLRRNEAYRQDYVAFGAAAPSEKETLAALIRARWGLRFPNRPRL